MERLTALEELLTGAIQENDEPLQAAIAEVIVSMGAQVKVTSKSQPEFDEKNTPDEIYEAVFEATQDVEMAFYASQNCDSIKKALASFR